MIHGEYILGDCMNYLHKYNDNTFDIAVVDPPYFTGPEKRRYYGKKISATNIKRMEYNVSDWAGQIPTNEYWQELKRVSKHQIIWGINYFHSFESVPAGRIIWDKCNQNSSFSDCEVALCTLHESVRQFRYMWNGMLQGKSLSEGHISQGNRKLTEKRIHPTQKPVLLYKWIVDTYFKEGWKVLDTHVGSGSSIIAYEDMGFEYTGFEIHKDYYDKSIDRIQKHLSQLSIF